MMMIDEKRRREPPVLLLLLASRRAAMTAALAAAAAAIAAPRRALASSPPPPPSEGDCADCVGVVDGLLNSCPGETEACVSSQNDDEAHFVAPWAYPGDRVAAMRRLVDVVAGVAPRGQLAESDRARLEAASDDDDGGGWTLTPAGEFTLNAPPPPRAEIGRGRSNARSAALASRVLAAGSFASAGRNDAGRNANDAPPRRVTTAVAAYDEAAGYIRLVVVDGERSSESVGAVGAVGADVYDVEFLFLEDDEVCDVRAAARDAPRGGAWSLSYVDGVKARSISTLTGPRATASFARWTPFLEDLDFFGPPTFRSFLSAHPAVVSIPTRAPRRLLTPSDAPIDSAPTYVALKYSTRAAARGRCWRGCG